MNLTSHGALIHGALIFAARAHDGQMRKGSQTPFFTHPAEVAQILAAAGGSPELIAAGYLHDVLEDTDVTSEALEAAFGSRVLALVRSDTEDKHLPWEARKAHTVSILSGAEPEAQMLACADKLSNLRTIRVDQLEVGEGVWSRFRRERPFQQWYYGAVLRALAPLNRLPMYQELQLLYNEVFSRDCPAFFVLETPRLLLRPWRETDAPALYEYARNPVIGTAAGWPPHTSVDESRQIIRDVFSAPETYALVSRETGLPIGAAGLLTGPAAHLPLGPDEAEIGYWLGHPHWGQGLMPEAVRALIDHAFRDLSCSALWCTRYADNHNSRRVQEKCGFSHCRTEPGPPPVEVSRLTRDDWHTSLSRPGEGCANTPSVLP